MTYTAPGFRGIQELRYGATAQKVYLRAEADGATVTVSGTPTYEVFMNGGDTAIASGNATNTSNTISASLDISDTSAYPLGRFYTARFTFTDGTTTWNRDAIFDVVRIPTDDDIPCVLDDLRGMHTRIDAALTQVSQTSDGQSRYIVPAWEDLRLFLEGNGINPTEINRASLTTIIRKMAGANIMRGLMQAPGDVFSVLADKYDAEAADAKQHIVAIGRTGDGLTTEKRRGMSQPSLLIGPDNTVAGTRLDWRKVES
jgi:hypothetical protein